MPWEAAGIVHSVKQGAVSYVAGNVQTADGQTRVLYTDCGCETGKGTFFLNMSGELVAGPQSFMGQRTDRGLPLRFRYLSIKETSRS